MNNFGDLTQQELKARQEKHRRHKVNPDCRHSRSRAAPEEEENTYIAAPAEPIETASFPSLSKEPDALNAVYCKVCKRFQVVEMHLKAGPLVKKDKSLPMDWCYGCVRKDALVKRGASLVEDLSRYDEQADIDVQDICAKRQLESESVTAFCGDKAAYKSHGRLSVFHRISGWN